MKGFYLRITPRNVFKPPPNPPSHPRTAGETDMAIRDTKKVSSTKHKEKQSRPKTFKTETAAKAWAKQQNIENFTLKNIRHLGAKDQKIRVVQG